MYKKLHVDANIIAFDLANTSNDAVKGINTVLLAGANQIKPKYQRNTVRSLSQLGLWIVFKDTAYRDVFFWILYQLLKRADKLMKLIEPYVKEPSEWYSNVWFDSRGTTAELKKEGKIPDNGKSLEETVFVKQIQEARHKKLLNGE